MKSISWFYSWFIFNMSDMLIGVIGVCIACANSIETLVAICQLGINLNTRKSRRKCMRHIEWFKNLLNIQRSIHNPGFNILVVEDLMTKLFVFNRRFVEIIIIFYFEICEVSNELLKTRPNLSRIFIIYFWNRLNSVVR